MKNSISFQFEEQNDLPTAFIVRVSLKYVKELHKEDASALNEAKKLLGDAIGRLNQSVQKAYSKQSVLVVVTQEEASESHSRVRRQAKADVSRNF